MVSCLERTSFSMTKVGYENHGTIFGRLRLTRTVEVIKGSKHSGNEGRDGEDGGLYRHRFHLLQHVDANRYFQACPYKSSLFDSVSPANYSVLNLTNFHGKIFNTKILGISSSLRYSFLTFPFFAM